MKTISITLVALSFLLFSCGNSNNGKSVEHTEATTHEEHQHGEESQSIELDNGQKWKVNAEMIPYVLDAEKALSQYDNVNYKALAKQLEDKNQGLIKSCTMVGQSHEELHKWLNPHIKLIEKLSSASNDHDANEVVAEINKSFETYKLYFD